MRALIAADRPIEMVRLEASQAIEELEQAGRSATASLLAQQGRCYVDCVELDGYRDYIFDTVLPSTGHLRWGFDLLPYEKGMLLLPPDRHDPSHLATFVPQNKGFRAFDHHLHLLRSLHVEDVAPLNTLVQRGRAAEMIAVAEAMQEKQIAAIASEITRLHRERGVRVVLISGPSSSGKTTFARRLHTQLLTNYLRPYALSLDDFFVNREDTPLDASGQYDFESLYALDLPYLGETLTKIIAGEEVEMPTFDFVTGHRVFKGNTLQLGRGELLIIEGIHALNPSLLSAISPDTLYRVYVSALTTLSIDAHNRISTSDNRLIRRIVRDAKYRGAPASKSIGMWPSVQRGERTWIFPFQENADAMFNSAMVYELAALRPQAEAILSRVKECDPAYGDARRLLRLLRYFEPIPLELLPPTSLLREFLGGSSYTY